MNEQIPAAGAPEQILRDQLPHKKDQEAQERNDGPDHGDWNVKSNDEDCND